MAFQAYRNLGRDSGVVAFDISPDSITVQFRSGSHYVYNSVAPGAAVVAKLKSLALSGHGLNSYLSKFKPRHHSKY